MVTGRGALRYLCLLSWVNPAKRSLKTLPAGSSRTGYFAVDERRGKRWVFGAKEMVDRGHGGKQH